METNSPGAFTLNSQSANVYPAIRTQGSEFADLAVISPSSLDFLESSPRQTRTIRVGMDLGAQPGEVLRNRDKERVHGPLWCRAFPITD